MKVKTLIKQLSKLDENLTVVCTETSRHYSTKYHKDVSLMIRTLGNLKDDSSKWPELIEHEEDDGVEKTKIKDYLCIGQ